MSLRTLLGVGKGGDAWQGARDLQTERPFAGDWRGFSDWGGVMGVATPSKKPKNLHGISESRPPPPRKKVTFFWWPRAQNRYITPTLLVSRKTVTFGELQLKTEDIMKGLKLSNSIYASKMMAGSGLDVQGGRLINNRPDGVSGIAQAAAAKKAMKYAKKLEMYSDAVALGYMKAESMEGPEESM